jgi:predicted metal-binding membrane protein
MSSCVKEDTHSGILMPRILQYIKIVEELRAAAGPNSKLLIVNCLMAYVCEDVTVAKDLPALVPLLRLYCGIGDRQIRGAI